MKLNRFLIAVLLPGTLLFLSKNIFSQDTTGHSFYAKALANSTTLYHRAFDNQSALYNGRKYGEYPFRFNDGHPFFYSVQPGKGAVIYDGILYDSILMRYDETRDVLIINDHADRIQLHSEKIKYFNLYNADFIRMEKDSIQSALVSSGFYNLLYNGKVSLLKKQIKSVRELITLNELQHFIDEKEHYYIRKDGGIYQVRKSRDLYRLFGDRKKEVQQFIKSNGLSFRKDKQNMLTRTTAYYDSLKK